MNHKLLYELEKEENKKLQQKIRELKTIGLDFDKDKINSLNI